MPKPHTFNCGHPRTDENTIGRVRHICRTCRAETARRDWREADPRDRHVDYRVRVLPTQLDRARRRVAQLENEARSLGLGAIL